MKTATSAIAFAGLVASVAAHGQLSSPKPRVPGDAMAAACGQQVYNNQAADSYGNVQGELQVAASQSDYDAASCDIWLCKGYKFEDNKDNVQSYTAGQTVEMEAEIRAPHTGVANVSIVDTASNTVIGSPLISWAEYASTAYTIPANQTKFSITIPEDLGSKCATAGDCVIQWYWFAESIDQTYESCIDFTVGGSGSGSGDSTPAPSSSAAAASSAAPATSAAASAPAASSPAVSSPAAAASSAAPTSAVEAVATSKKTKSACTKKASATAAPTSAAPIATISGKACTRLSGSPTAAASSAATPVSVADVVSSSTGTPVASATVTAAPQVSDVLSALPALTTALPSELLTSALPTAAPTGDASNPAPSKPLPEGATLKDLLIWLDWMLHSIFRAESKHARDLTA